MTAICAGEEFFVSTSPAGLCCTSVEVIYLGRKRY